MLLAVAVRPVAAGCCSRRCWLALDTCLWYKMNIMVLCMPNLSSLLLAVRFYLVRLSSSSSRRSLTARLALSAFLNLGSS